MTTAPRLTRSDTSSDTFASGPDRPAPVTPGPPSPQLRIAPPTPDHRWTHPFQLVVRSARQIEGHPKVTRPRRPALSARAMVSDVSPHTAAAVEFVGFLAVLAVADRCLSRWGSEAIRQRPRPGGRVTLLFAGICLVCALLELAAFWLWTVSSALAVVVALLQFPAAGVVVIALDRALPTRSTSAVEPRTN